MEEKDRIKKGGTMQGFEQAQREYEAKMSDPYADEEESSCDAEEYFTDMFEEMLLRQAEEDSLWR